MKELANESVTWLHLFILVYGVIFISVITFYISKWHYKRKIKRKQEIKCPKCLKKCTQEELDLFGGICEGCDEYIHTE